MLSLSHGLRLTKLHQCLQALFPPIIQFCVKGTKKGNQVQYQEGPDARSIKYHECALLLKSPRNEDDGTTGDGVALNRDIS